MSPLEVALMAVLGLASAYAGGRWLFQKDTEAENRRRGAAKLATVLTGLGLSKIPEFLTDYSVDDKSGMIVKIKNLADLFLSSESAVVDEFGKVFDNVLDAKLNTEDGRAFIAVKLADAARKGDPSAVVNAPHATIE